MASYISVQYLKDNAPYLDLSHYSDTTTSGMISRASEMVNNFTQRDFMVQNLTAEKADTVVDTQGNIVVYPRVVPIQSITAMKVVYGTVEVDLTVTQNGVTVFDIPEPKFRAVSPNESTLIMTGPTLLDFKYLLQYETYTELDYRGGYTDVPEDIKEATLLYALDMFSKRQNLSGAQSITQGGVSISYGTGGGGRSDFVLDAETILMKYKKVA